MNQTSTYNNGNSTPRGWVLVVEDDPGGRELILTTLGTAGYEARGAATAAEALEFTRDERPALVLTDVALPSLSGYELCHILRERFGETLPIIFVSGVRTEDFDLVAGFLIGADDYIVKPFVPGELIARVRRSLARSATSHIQSPQTSAHELTPRECEVLGLLAEGLSQKEIAARLVISSKTVSTHIQRMLGKLDLHSRAEAVAWAYRVGAFADKGGPAPALRDVLASAANGSY
jgi:DNA-binding NarL/FixJ family response regulator